jgi:hypothetical protein
MATWNILWRFRVFYDHLLHFVFIWYIFPVLLSCTKKNLANLQSNQLIIKYVGWHVLTLFVFFSSFVLIKARRRAKLLRCNFLWPSTIPNQNYPNYRKMFLVDKKQKINCCHHLMQKWVMHLYKSMVINNL